MKIALLAALGATVFAASASDAAVNIYVSQAGTSVYAQALGTLDLTGLTKGREGGTGIGAVIRGAGYIITGAAARQQQGYSGFSGFSTFAFGDYTTQYADIGTGDGFSVVLGSELVYVPLGYVSGSAISSDATFNNQTLARLGLNLGDYTLTAGNGDTVSLHVGQAAPAAVPEPASWAMFIGGFGLIGGAMRRRQRTSVRFA
ncbi:PEPxxWA-CTERM sorting domain-containing protein [Sphingomonas sp. BIUV-7]|uniref:PEPxxWA-CTERM sorting domain-containing protein n=1 Tax=Sphingomonas natans TaxID=3063330 RepID=A0ABT8Y5G4_9SPHN|nr:PEPxxWA-CTERM sorting domain-containing protein [Sphingomonas sp. BIUV-7]MDO6413143.1 PEPxxWA-CTERM sorting domain-containing protein [Sphingomonas sp. BIUV-7]